MSAPAENARVGVTTNANAPVNTAHPTVSGTTNRTAYPGQTLTADPGTWNPTGTIAYQWMSSSDGGTTWTPISGATSASYTLAGSDTGNEIRITVTETNRPSTIGLTVQPVTKELADKFNRELRELGLRFDRRLLPGTAIRVGPILKTAAECWPTKAKS